MGILAYTLTQFTSKPQLGHAMAINVARKPLSESLLSSKNDFKERISWTMPMTSDHPSCHARS